MKMNSATIVAKNASLFALAMLFAGALLHSAQDFVEVI